MKIGTRVQINSNGDIYGGVYDGRTAITLEEDGYPWVKLDTGEVIDMGTKYLTQVEPSIDNLMVGDMLIYNIESHRRVDFIGNNEAILLSDGKWYSKYALKELGFKVTVYSSTKTILTKKMIADHLGLNEDDIEIK